MAGGGWSHLPLDLFSLIFSKLSLPQFLRSAAVCLPWSAAVRDLSTDALSSAGRAPGSCSTTIPSDRCLEQYHLKAILSADPSLEDGYTVALVQYPHGRVFFTNSGDEQWSDLRNPIPVQNMVFHKGKLYMSTNSEVCVCDLEVAQIEHGGGVPIFRVVDQAVHRDDLHYLFETPRGDLLSIYRERNYNLTKTLSVRVCRVVIDDEEKPIETLKKTMDMREFIFSIDGGIRVEVGKDLGDLIISLGGGNALCLSAGDFSHLTPNSIYFTDDDLIRLPMLSPYLMPLFLDRNWFQRILNCPISIANTFVQLYWQPSSSSVD
ncbi:hypothetical protein ZIOFF_004350 [Zingiber officinale]|uniref:F-box domain-containing protein n=1 Tax=Zingiber officinale TaxID=94328 RepID=A0A8J5I0H6_ZINOF|nr:hypothetical protein ZIOFF_004350 [Zingiber officinale]